MCLRELDILISYGVIIALFMSQILHIFECDIMFVMKKKIRRSVDKRRLTVGMMLLMLYTMLIYFAILDIMDLLVS